MARLFVGAGAADEGTLTIEDLGEGCVDVYYNASQARLDQYNVGNEGGNDHSDSAPSAMKLLQIHGVMDFVKIFPLVTFPNQRFMKPKYPWIESITLEGFGFETPTTVRDVQLILEDLPAGFVKDYDYGLGLQKDYDYIVTTLRRVRQIRCLAVCREEDTKMRGEVFAISEWHFDKIRKGINKINKNFQTEGRVDKEIFAYNALLHRLDAAAFPERKRPYKRDTIYRFVSGGDAPGALLSEKDKDAAITLVAANAKEIAATKTNSLLELRNDIELVTLEELINKFESMLQDSKESNWQRFFRENAFVLGLAFSVPIVVVDEQVNVGGRSLQGRGEKITDFLTRSSMTNNTALVEIKTPATPLLGGKYREGVFAPSRELVGSVTQILDQREKFEKQFPLLKLNSPEAKVESYSIRCFLVIGQTPSERPQQRSFELFRNNSRGVDIITFDELLEKLRNIYDFLAEAQDSKSP